MRIHPKCLRGKHPSQAGNKTDVVEELEQINVVGLAAEVLLEEEVDGALEHKGIVDGDVVDAVLDKDTRKERFSSQRVKLSASKE